MSQPAAVRLKFRRGAYVYIAGPLTSDHIAGARQAILAAGRLLRAGYVPVVPHLSILWQLLEPVGYEDWLSYDFALLARCDVLLRLPGESPGADREIEEARRLGLHVIEREADLYVCP